MITMYDSIYVSNLPAGAEAYAGYVDGRWPTFSSLPAAAHKLSIAVFPSDNAMCLDIEAGDAVNSQAPGWWRQAEGNHYLYTSAANAQALINEMEAAGIARSSYKLWTAHYAGYSHLCAPSTCGYPQADGTQYTDAGPDNCDVSLLADDFFTTSPPPKPQPPMEDDVQIPPGPVPVGVSFDGTPYTTIGFLADPSSLGGVTVTVRCAFHNVKTNAFSVQTVNLTAATPKVVVNVPANTDGVSFARQDTENVTLVPNFN